MYAGAHINICCGKFYFLDVSVAPEESEDEMEFDEVPIEPFEDATDDEVEETLEQAVRNMHERGAFGGKLDSCD